MLRANVISLAMLAILLGACSVRTAAGGPTPGAPPAPGGSGGSGGAPAPTGWPTLAPGASFNGAPCSGYPGGVCVNNDRPIYTCSGFGGGCVDGGNNPAGRPQAQPAVHWIVPSDQRIASDTLICVDADAKGGIAYVKFYGEGGTAQVATPGFITDTDANGRARKRWGYCVKLDAAAWKARTTTGTGKLYAEAVANDSRMAHRIIGTPSIDVDGQGRSYNTEQLAGNYPMVVYPRATANDWSKTVCASGCDYSTIKSALDAAQAASAEAPIITLNATGFFELENRADYTGGKGFATIKAAPGVTATLGRAAAFHPSNSGSWSWRPGWDGLEFRGQGILFDVRNWTSVVFNSKAPWFNGVRFTNSIGTRDTTYWNGQSRPDFSSNVGGYWDDVYMEYIAGAMTSQRYVINSQLKQVGGHVFSGTNYVYGTYLRGYSNQYFRGVTPVLSLTYSGPGSATLSCTGTYGAAGTCTGKVDGATVFTLAQGAISTDANPTVSQLAAAISGYSNWNATVLNGRGAWSSAALFPHGGAYGAFANIAVTAGGTNFTAGKDVHAEWMQMYSCCGPGVPQPRQNLIVRNNVARDFQVGPFVNSDCDLCYDFVFKNNVFLADPAAVADQTVAVALTYFAGARRNHFVFNHNTFEAMVVREQVGVQDLLFSQFNNNIVGEAFRSGGTNFGADQPWNHNFYIVRSDIGDMGVTGGTGNIAYANTPANPTVQFNNLFAGLLNGDFLHALGGLISGNQKVAVEIYDQRGCAYSASDNAGAWSKNCAATAWPF